MSCSEAVKTVEVIHCPYDPLHVMPKESFLRHLEKCKSKNKNEFRQCPYNIFHVMKKQIFDQHIAHCPSKNDLRDLCQDQWGEVDQHILQVQDWGQEQNWKDNQKQIDRNGKTSPRVEKYERNILAESIVRPINIFDDDHQTLTPTHQLTEQMRNLILNCQEDRQSQSYWLGNKNQEQIQVKRNQKQQTSQPNSQSKIFAQSCIINRDSQQENYKNVLGMSFYQGMKPTNSIMPNNNQNFIIDYSISQVHNYNNLYPQNVLPYFQAYNPMFGYQSQFMHSHLNYPNSHFINNRYQSHYNRAQKNKEERELKKKRKKQEKSKQKDKKEKKDKKKSKKSYQ